ncbi:MAG: heavy metal translocating P-type ATPase [Clostridia bacterium]|nr:heavy metal translocating P-type ATPase [Clostridia bacterium]
MKCRILHESMGRLRVHLMQGHMTLDQADILEYYLKSFDFITDAVVYERTADAVIRYQGDRTEVIRALSSFRYEGNSDLVPEKTGRALAHEFEDKVILHVGRRLLNLVFLPLPLRNAITAVKAVRFLKEGVKVLAAGHIQVPVLDAATIGISMLRGDFDTAGNVIFLLGLSEILEEWTHKKTVDDLARSMSLNIDKVWLKTAEGQEMLVPVSEIRAGDMIVIRTSNTIPLDGIVSAGEASVNQASLTGESLPVRKAEGAYVYAGTVIEEGEITVTVKNTAGSGRYDRIVEMIEESEKLKSDSENRAAALADRLVPWSLGGTLITYLLTRNMTKALSILMVDYSCALKLSIPIAVLSGMREASNYGISVRGGKFLETVAEAKTIVYDKTGTLTHSTPRVAAVIPFGKNDEAEMLRLAACLEEHYPHSIANAVVNEATRRGLTHEERHSRVEYVVAHGIVSHIDGKRVLIGSYHFVFEDEGCTIPAREKKKFNSLPDDCSHLYMAMDGKLCAVICIEDPIRAEAPAVISQLRKLGINRQVMMTGDSERTARAVAELVGVDEYHSEVLPEDKAALVKAEQQDSRKVIMIGDGINDTPALSQADVAIAISNGAAIAREIADITVPEGNLSELVTLRQLSKALSARISSNYRFILSFNSALILLGVLGVLPPATTAYLHNFSTLALSVRSMTDVL